MVNAAGSGLTFDCWEAQLTNTANINVINERAFIIFLFFIAIFLSKKAQGARRRVQGLITAKGTRGKANGLNFILTWSAL